MIATLVADPDRGRGDPGTPNNRFRLRRPPPLEPPYDDERHAMLPGSAASGSASSGSAASGSTSSGSAVQSPQLPLDWHGCAQAPSTIGPSYDSPTPPVAIEATSTYAAQRYIRLCLEVLNGFRPLSHLRSLTGPVEFADVVTQLSRRRNGQGHFPQSPTSVPATNCRAGTYTRAVPADFNAAPDRFALPTGPMPIGAVPAVAVAPIGPGGRSVPPRPRRAPAAQPFRLLRLRVSEPRDGIAEAVAILSHAGASLAMALRLERRDTSWICTVVRVI